MLATKQAKQTTNQTAERVTFKNILFATDFLPGAQAAFPHAAGLAKSFGANLYALHVNEPVNYALPPEAWVAMQTAVEAEKKALRERFQRECPEVAGKIIEAEGEIWTAVETAIEKYEIDLVVVGTRGRTGLEKVLLGSKAEEILRRAHCPVLTVGPDVPAKLGTHEKIGSILYATQFGTASLKFGDCQIRLNPFRFTALRTFCQNAPGVGVPAMNPFPKRSWNPELVIFRGRQTTRLLQLLSFVIFASPEMNLGSSSAHPKSDICQ
jgi:nucleotide-binding universal stress UspA family protein